MAFDTQLGESAHTRSGLALLVLPSQKGGRCVHRRGLGYAQFDVQMHAPGLPFPTKLVYDLAYGPHMESFHQHRSPDSENRVSDEV
jgi:hypothetical protein